MISTNRMRQGLFTFMEGRLDVVRIPSNTRYNPFSHSLSEHEDVDAVFCIERSNHGCFHEFKAPYIMRKVTHSVFDFSNYKPVAQISDSPSDIFIVTIELAEMDRFTYHLSRFVACRRDFDNSKRYIFLGDETSPFFEVFLLFAFPALAFVCRNGEFIDVSSDPMRRLSYRGSLAILASKCNKIGCLLDSTEGVNSQLLRHLFAISCKFGLKIYYLSIGRIEDYKLGNFPDIDLFVNLQCQYCFDFRKKYMKPVLSYYEFAAGLLDCFWEFPYGDISSLLARNEQNLLGEKSLGLLQNRQSDFVQSFSCQALCMKKEENQEDTKIETGLIGIPRSYGVL